MFYFDPTYIIILPALIFSIWASSRVNSTFTKYERDYSYRGYTGAMAAREILNSRGLYDVGIERVNGRLSDHYDPKANVIRLSDAVYNSTSTAAIGVACHEAGHAMQYADSYLPIKFRALISPMTNIGSTVGIWLFIIGLILSFPMVCFIGIVLFSFTAIFQLATLPTEYNASRRALEAIEESGILNQEEHLHAKKVLSAAALTYVAALAVSLTQLLRLLVLFGNTRRRN